jgi:hypothetical protein
MDIMDSSVKRKQKTICIIGAGLGGGILAFDLSKRSDISLIIIDTDKITVPYIQDKQKELLCDVPTPTAEANYAINKGIGHGGSSNLWHGVLTKFDECDWDILNKTSNHDISAEIKPFYKAVDSLFGVSTVRGILPRISVAENSLNNKIDTSGMFKRKEFFVQKKPYRSRSDLLKIYKKNNVEFIENAIALYFEYKNKDTNSTKLVVNIKGKNRSIEADYFVLATGALETPRIIQQSILEYQFKIDSDLTGKYLVDHPYAIIGEIKEKNNKKFRLGLSDVASRKGALYRVGYRLRSSDELPTIGKNNCISIKPLFIGEYNSFKETLKSIIHKKITVHSLCQLFLKHRLRDIIASFILLLFEKLALGVYIKRAIVFCYLEQPLRVRSSITLTNRKDEYGRIIPQISICSDNHEKNSILKMQSVLKRVLSRSKKYKFFEFPLSSITLESGMHHAGTMRIGKDSSNGVVDKDLKVYGTKNIYVCDLSIFPNYGNSNPSYSLAAFSLRLSDHLKNI